MKKCLIACLAVAMSLFNLPAFSQTKNDSAALGLPGDNLDLYAVLNLFQKSKTIEEFEKSLNEQKTGINNLDLDLDKKVDFIKVVTEKKGDAFTFILQVAVSKTETQDVAVILVDKDKNKKVTMQIIGDEELYGKNYIVEPKTGGTPSVTANPAYVGPEPVTKSVPATTTVLVETVPIVQYVYSPVYVPYVPPYHYGFYPPYFAAFTVMAVGIYRHNNYYYHGHGYGYHNTVVINNSNHYNNYNNVRNTSNTVSHNNASGNYGNRPSTQPSNGGASASTRPSNGPSASTRPANGNGPSASTRPSNGPSASTQPSNNGPSASTRQSASNMSSQKSTSMGEGRSKGGGGGYSGGGGGGGARRGGGGGGRRR